MNRGRGWRPACAAAVLCIAVLVAGPGASRAASPSPRIVGGGKANAAGWQFTVALEQKRHLICTGSLIAPANAAIAVGVLAAIPILVIGPGGGFSVSIAATGLIYLSYLLCNIGVLAARFRGWPHTEGVVQPRPMGQAGQHPRPGSTAGS